MLHRLELLNDGKNTKKNYSQFLRFGRDGQFATRREMPNSVRWYSRHLKRERYRIYLLMMERRRQPSCRFGG